jgi:hypothetical protein|tara:strand:+ start:1359 stop:1784 length:426 start_codon:yes stop_codon:yes gene_type:complete
MSLLHTPTYEVGYNEEDDRQELKKLLWSQFMCKCGRCSVKTGKNFMERLPVFILDEIALEERMRFDIDLGYVCKPKADKLLLVSKNPHRAGLAIKIRILNTSKRLRVVRGLIVRGVTRIALANEYVYFDTDDLKSMALYLR